MDPYPSDPYPARSAGWSQAVEAYRTRPPGRGRSLATYGPGPNMERYPSPPRHGRGMDPYQLSFPRRDWGMDPRDERLGMDPRDERLGMDPRDERFLGQPLDP